MPGTNGDTINAAARYLAACRHIVCMRASTLDTRLMARNVTLPMPLKTLLLPFAVIDIGRALIVREDAFWLTARARLAERSPRLADDLGKGRFCGQWSENSQQSYAPHDYLPRPR